MNQQSPEAETSATVVTMIAPGEETVRVLEDAVQGDSSLASNLFPGQAEKAE